MRIRIKKLLGAVMLFVMTVFMMPATYVYADSQINEAVLDARNGVVKICFYMNEAAFFFTDGKKIL